MNRMAMKSFWLRASRTFLFVFLFLSLSVATARGQGALIYGPFISGGIYGTDSYRGEQTEGMFGAGLAGGLWGLPVLMGFLEWNHLPSESVDQVRIGAILGVYIFTVGLSDAYNFDADRVWNAWGLETDFPMPLLDLVLSAFSYHKEIFDLVDPYFRWDWNLVDNDHRYSSYQIGVRYIFDFHSWGVFE